LKNKKIDTPGDPAPKESTHKKGRTLRGLARRMREACISNTSSPKWKSKAEGSKQKTKATVGRRHPKENGWVVHGSKAKKKKRESTHTVLKTKIYRARSKKQTVKRGDHSGNQESEVFDEENPSNSSDGPGSLTHGEC